MKRVLITGQHSYIGTSFEHYIRKYCPRWQVDSISVHGDGWKQYDFGGYDAVLHVAGKAHADTGRVSEEVKREYYRVNCDLAREVAEAAKSAGVRQFIYPGSIIIYGESAPYGRQKMITADTKPAPANFYGDSKWQADLAVRGLADGAFHVAVLRLPMVYGAEGKGNYPMLSKLAKWLPVFPAVQNSRSMLYIENLCELIREIVEQGEGGVFFPQNAQYASTAEVVEAVSHAVGKRVVLLPFLNPLVKLCCRMPGKIGCLANKAFGSFTYEKSLSEYNGNRYQRYDLKQSIRRTERGGGNRGMSVGHPPISPKGHVPNGGNKAKKALVTASVASMIDLFSMDNIHILQQMGYEVHVASNFEFGSITSQERVDTFREELKQAGIAVYHIPIPRSIGDLKNIFLSYRQMKRLCTEQKYDLIHTQSPIGRVIARLSAKKLRAGETKVIYTAHGFHFYKGASKKNWLLFYPVERYLSRFTDVLITINKEDYKRAKGFYAKRACYVPGIGVDIERFGKGQNDTDKLRQEFGFAKDDFVVISVGQLSKRKNQETMIRAMAHIPDKSIKYLVVGLGECEQEDQKLIQGLGLKGQVVLAGYREDVDALLQMADCFVFPSIQEGLPVSLMEAMAAGVPVVCSRIRGNTDLITDGVDGLLTGPMDEAGYAKAVMKLKKEPRLKELLHKNAKEKIKQFDVKRVHCKMLRIYQDCMDLN